MNSSHVTTHRILPTCFHVAFLIVFIFFFTLCESFWTSSHPDPVVHPHLEFKRFEGVKLAQPSFPCNLYRWATRTVLHSFQMLLYRLSYSHIILKGQGSEFTITTMNIWRERTVFPAPPPSGDSFFSLFKSFVVLHLLVHLLWSLYPKECKKNHNSTLKHNTALFFPRSGRNDAVVLQEKLLSRDLLQ